MKINSSSEPFKKPAAKGLCSKNQYVRFTDSGELLRKYKGESALLFGSYARGDYTDQSDVDVVVYGGKDFRPIDIFAFGEDLRELTNKDADVFEIREINKDTDFYRNIMKDGVRIS